MLDYFLAASSNFLYSPLFAWQSHSNNKTSGSCCSQPRNSFVSFGQSQAGNYPLFPVIYAMLS